MNPIFRSFILEEISPYTRKLIYESIDRHNNGSKDLQVRFEFNRFDITLNFVDKTVLIEDILVAGENGELTIDLNDFKLALKEVFQ